MARGAVELVKAVSKSIAAGTITLNGVSASNFTRGNGAWLESDKGITVKNSLFNNNSDNSTLDGYGYG